MESLLKNFFNLQVYIEVFPFLMQGLWMTLTLSAMVIPIGIITGLGVALIATQVDNRWVRWGIAAYVDVFRALPPLVLLIFIYYGAPFLGLDLPKMLAIAIGFMLNNSSYYGEIFRAGIQSIPKGQMEAARSTGLTHGQALVYVIIPQASRNALPELLSNSIEIVKTTTIASVIALPELLRVARDAQSLIYSPSPVVLAGLIYIALLWPLVRLLSRLEHRNRVMR